MLETILITKDKDKFFRAYEILLNNNIDYCLRASDIIPHNKFKDYMFDEIGRPVDSYYYIFTNNEDAEHALELISDLD